jgi:hypothetical protein
MSLGSPQGVFRIRAPSPRTACDNEAQLKAPLREHVSEQQFTPDTTANMYTTTSAEPNLGSWGRPGPPSTSYPSMISRLAEGPPEGK